MKAFLKDLVKLTYNDANGNIIIGGNQQHYDQYIRRYDGCGPIAATNIWLYLMLHNHLPQNIIDLPLNQAKIKSLADHIYQKMPPIHLYDCDDKNDMIDFDIFGQHISVTPSLGTFSTTQFSDGMSQLASTFEQPIIAYYFRPAFNDSLSDWRNFIVQHLNANHPIALLNTFNAVNIKFSQPFDDHLRDDIFKLHWVIIVELEETAGDIILYLLSWGGIAQLSLTELWQKNRDNLFFKGQMIAYQLAEKKPEKQIESEH